MAHRLLALEETLKVQGRSVAWLARKCGVSVSYAWRMIHGERPLTDQFKARAAGALGVPETLLFPDPQPDPVA